MYEDYTEHEWKDLGPEYIRKLSMACAFDLITPNELLNLLEEEEYGFLLNNENAIRKEFPRTGIFYEMVHMLRMHVGDEDGLNYRNSLSFCETYEKLVKQCKASI